MNATVLDIAERVGWTAVQAFAGSLAAGGTAVSFGTFDWRAAGVGAATAALLALLKVLGVNAAAAASRLGPDQTPPPPPEPVAPAVQPVAGQPYTPTPLSRVS